MSICLRVLYFNPLPRKEGDELYVLPSTFAIVISIHSLVKRETSSSTLFKIISDISIHSLVKRETVSDFVFLRAIKFQSTPS